MAYDERPQLDRRYKPQPMPHAGHDMDLQANGASTDRPSDPYLGQPFFDTTLGTPIWFDGTNWVDATGATV